MKKVCVDGKCFNWVENITYFSKDFIKTIMKTVMEDASLKFVFNVLKNYLSFKWIGIEKGWQIQLRILVNTMHWYEHRSKTKFKNKPKKARFFF